MSQATVSTTSRFTPESGTIADLRLAEARATPGDRAPVGARVEEVGRLDERRLGVGEPAEDRLRHDRLGLAAARRRGAAPQRGRACAPCGETRATIGPPSLTQPCSSATLLAERADVDELAAVRREAERALAEQERALADRARATTVACVTRIGVTASSACRPLSTAADGSTPSPPRAPSSPRRSPSGRCASAPPRSAGSASGSRRGRRSARSATGSR